MGNSKVDGFFYSNNKVVELLPSFNLRSGDFHNNKNYGKFLPVGCIYKSLLFLDPCELISCFRTCKLIFEIGSTNSFWKEYFFNFFGKSDGEHYFVEKDTNNNWKQEFYNKSRDYLFTDEFYRIFYGCVKGICLVSFRNSLPIWYKKSFLYERNYESYRILAVGKSGKDYLFKLGVEFSVGEKFIKFEKGNYIQSSVPSSDNITVGYYDSPFTKIKNESQDYIFWGVLLCFSVHDHSSFEQIQGMIPKMLEDNDDLNSNTIFLLIGMNYEHGVGKRDKDVRYHSEIEEYVFSKKHKGALSNMIIGYIECTVTTKSKLGKNIMFSFGTIIDAVMRKGRCCVKERKEQVFCTSSEIMSSSAQKRRRIDQVERSEKFEVQLRNNLVMREEMLLESISLGRDEPSELDKKWKNKKRRVYFQKPDGK